MSQYKAVPKGNSKIVIDQPIRSQHNDEIVLQMSNLPWKEQKGSEILTVTNQDQNFEKLDQVMPLPKAGDKQTINHAHQATGISNVTIFNKVYQQPEPIQQRQKQVFLPQTDPYAAMQQADIQDALRSNKQNMRRLRSATVLQIADMSVKSMEKFETDYSVIIPLQQQEKVNIVNFGDSEYMSTSVAHNKMNNSEKQSHRMKNRRNCQSYQSLKGLHKPNMMIQQNKKILDRRQQFERVMTVVNQSEAQNSLLSGASSQSVFDQVKMDKNLGIGSQKKLVNDLIQMKSQKYLRSNKSQQSSLFKKSLPKKSLMLQQIPFESRTQVQAHPYDNHTYLSKQTAPSQNNYFPKKSSIIKKSMSISSNNHRKTEISLSQQLFESANKTQNQTSSILAQTKSKNSQILTPSEEYSRMNSKVETIHKLQRSEDSDQVKLLDRYKCTPPASLEPQFKKESRKASLRKGQRPLTSKLKVQKQHEIKMAAQLVRDSHGKELSLEAQQYFGKKSNPTNSHVHLKYEMGSSAPQRNIIGQFLSQRETFKQPFSSLKITQQLKTRDVKDKRGQKSDMKQKSGSIKVTKDSINLKDTLALSLNTQNMDHFMNVNPMYAQVQTEEEQNLPRKQNEDLINPLMPMQSQKEIDEQRLIAEYLKIQNYESQQAYLDDIIRNAENVVNIQKVAPIDTEQIKAGFMNAGTNYEPQIENLQLKSFDSITKHHNNSLSNQISIEPDQAYGINLEGSEVKDNETLTFSKDIGTELRMSSSKTLIENQGRVQSASAFRQKSQNTNPQLKETIQIESTTRINGQIENLTFGVELKGEPIKMAAKPQQKATQAAVVVPNAKLDLEKLVSYQEKLNQHNSSPYKSSMLSSLKFTDLIQEEQMQDYGQPQLQGSAEVDNLEDTISFETSDQGIFDLDQMKQKQKHNEVKVDFKSLNTSSKILREVERRTKPRLKQCQKHQDTIIFDDNQYQDTKNTINNMNQSRRSFSKVYSQQQKANRFRSLEKFEGSSVSPKSVIKENKKFHFLQFCQDHLLKEEGLKNRSNSMKQSGLKKSQTQGNMVDEQDKLNEKQQAKHKRIFKNMIQKDTLTRQTESQQFRNVFKTQETHETLENLEEYSPNTTRKKWILSKKKQKNEEQLKKQEEKKKVLQEIIKMEPEQKKWTKDKKFQILNPSYCDPIYRRKSKFIKHQNHVIMQYDEKESDRRTMEAEAEALRKQKLKEQMDKKAQERRPNAVKNRQMTTAPAKQVEQVIVMKAQCVLEFPFTPDKYLKKVLELQEFNKQMRSKFIKKVGSDVNKIGGNMGLLMDQVKKEIKVAKKKEDQEKELQQQNYVQNEKLKAMQQNNAEEDDDEDADIDMKTIKQLCFDYEQQIEFGPPVKFTIRKICEAGDSKSKEVLDIYMSSSTTKPNAKNHQLHRQLKFGEKTMANYEAKAQKPQIYQIIFDKESFAIDPDESEDEFGFAKEKGKIAYRQRKLYISIVGEKACELDIQCELTLETDLGTYLKELEEDAKNLDEEAVMKLNKKLTDYFEYNKAKYKDPYEKNFEQQNKDYIQELQRGLPLNIKNADCLLDKVYQQKGLIMEKRDMRMVKAIYKRKQIERQKLDLISKKSQKWGKYRNDLVDAQDNLIQLRKNLSRFVCWISIIKAHCILKRVTTNYQRWKDNNRRTMMEFFLGIKIRIQFRRRFLRNHGLDFNVRFQRQYQRHQTFAVQCLQNLMKKRATKIVVTVISRVSAAKNFIEKVFYFRSKILVLQDLWMQRVAVSQGRLQEGINKFKWEHEYLTWFYTEKQQLALQNKKKEENQIIIKETTYILTQLSEFQKQIDEENVLERNAIILKLIQRQTYDFIFDYILWRFTQINLQILAINELDDMDQDLIEQLRSQIIKERHSEVKMSIVDNWLMLAKQSKATPEESHRFASSEVSIQTKSEIKKSGEKAAETSSEHAQSQSEEMEPIKYNPRIAEYINLDYNERQDMIERLRAQQGYNLERMKDFKIKIYQMDELIFSETFLVDRDSLFQIDPCYEVHNRNLQKDISIVSDEKKKGAAKKSKPNNTKSSSTHEKPCVMSDQKAKRNYGMVKKTKPMTFAKYENQSECVEILLRQYNQAIDKDKPQLSEKEQLKEEKLYQKYLEPYLRHEYQFPTYVQKFTHENFQRILLKCANVEIE